MLILMNSDHTKTELEAVLQKVRALKLKPHVIPGAQSVAVGITGNAGALDPREFTVLSGVRDAVPVTKPYKLAGRDFKHGDTVVKVGPYDVGAKGFIAIAGPCAVESEEQTLRIARAVKAAGAQF